MFTALVDAVRKGAVPAEIACADLRAVVGASNALLKLFEMTVADVRRSAFARPVATGARIGERVEEIVLLVAFEVAEGGFVAAHAFAIEVAEAVKERALAIVSFGGEDNIDETIDQSLLGARSVGGGDDEITEEDERFVLVVVEEERLPVWSGEILRGVDTVLCGSELGSFGWWCGLRRGERRAERGDGAGDSTCS